MYSYKRKNLPKNTVELSIVSPWKDIKIEYDLAFEDLKKNMKSEGFRKGKVPKEIAEKKIPKSDVYDKLIRTYLTKIYGEIVKKEEMKPIISPKLELKEAAENKDWKMTVTTAEAPEVKLGSYKDAAKKAGDKAMKSNIWVPGKDVKENDKDKEKQDQAVFQAKLSAVLDSSNAEISDLIVEEEVNGRLAKIVDDVQRVGLSMEKYLESKGLTNEKLKAQITKEIVDTYKMEFILQKIADEEKIEVSSDDIQKMLNNVKDEKEKQSIQQNAYYYASLLRKQKTLEYINSL